MSESDISQRLEIYKRKFITEKVEIQISAMKLEVDQIQQEIYEIQSFLSGKSDILKQTSRVPKIKMASIRAYLQSLQARSSELQVSIQESLDALEKIENPEAPNEIK